ncbi:MAG: heat-inducible transcriptional repressor HrcA [Dissulfurispiraceae bacterium]|jgi:heat-inducible transcriptional repressor
MVRDIFDIIDERSRRVLNAVVRSYIDRPDPVGSRFVTRKYSFGFSPATIRNIMADLEEMGFLSQPHTSAGRVPTDKGYRFYVDSLQDEDRSEKIMEAPEEFIQQFSRRLDEFKNDVSAMFSEVTNTLSSLSHYVSVVLPPNAENTTFNRIDLIKYKGDQIVAILLTDEGMIRNKVIQADPLLRQEDLNRIADYLNAEFSGHTLDEINNLLMQRMKREKAQWDRLISCAISIYEQAQNFAQDDIFVSGMYDVMNLPDFSDVSKIRELSKAIKEKHVIIKLLAELSSAEGVQVVIGSENPVNELKGLSVVTSMYKEGSRPMGIIALIGPTRMDYSKAISMVDIIAGCVSRTFED